MGLILAFTVGVLLLQILPELPAPLFGLLMPLPALLARLIGYQRLSLSLIVLAAGFGWAWFCAAEILSHRPAQAALQQDIPILACVTDFPRQVGRRTDLFVRLKTPSAEAELPAGSRLYLHGYFDKTGPQARECWQLTVRLRQPRIPQFLGDFDESAWLFRQRILAVGSVIGAAEHRQDIQPNSLEVWLRLRQFLALRINVALVDHPYLGVIRGLTIGDVTGISRSQWQIFSATGTTHLIAISGQHIALVAGMVYLAALAIWRRFPAGLARLSAQRAATIPATLAGYVYAGLAGMGVPTQRAVVMLVMASLGVWLSRQIHPWRLLWLALVGVLMFDPSSSLAPGLWLSFGAVACLLYVGQYRLARTGKLRQFLSLQWAVTWGLVPVVLFWFGTQSLVAPLVNLLAVPWYSVVVVPLALLGLLFSPLPWPLLSEGCFYGAAFAVELIWPAWQWAASFPMAMLSLQPPPLWRAIIATLGVFWYLAPRGWPSRWLGLVTAVIILFWPAQVPSLASAEVTALGIGKGIAVVIRTQNHTLLYGAGLKHPGGGDSGTQAILPYLRSIGVGSLDSLVLPAERSGWTGGYRSVLAQSSETAVWMGGDPIEYVPEALPCSEQQWDWDGVVVSITSDAQPNGFCHLQLRVGDSLLNLDPEQGVRVNGEPPVAFPDSAGLHWRFTARQVTSSQLVPPRRRYWQPPTIIP